MSISLSILLLCLFSLSFWVLSSSTIKWQIKVSLVVGFSLFTIAFYQSTISFLGWGAPPRALPEILSIRSVVIKEPNKFTKEDGGIWFLIEQPTVNYNESSLKVFGYNVKDSEPRLFVLPYSRKLHEQLSTGEERSVISRTQRGQIVRGTLVKGFSEGQGKAGKGFPGQKGSKDGKGQGSESQEQEWKFYDLKPSYFQEK
jgi:hypothetical protein